MTASAALPRGPAYSLCCLADAAPLTPGLMLHCCAQGLFPTDYGGQLRWQVADPHAVLEPGRIRIPARIATYLRKDLFELRMDADVPGVLAGCAARAETWLTPRLIEQYRALAGLGALHTVEAWQDGRLVGGLFGIALGRVFTLESMFSAVDHASKLAFVRLARHLAERGYDLIDCQVQQPHFERFGAAEIPLVDFRERMARGLARPVSFLPEA